MRKQTYSKPIKLQAHQAGNKIILDPLVEISAETIFSVKRGLEDIKNGKVSEFNRNFSKHLNDDEFNLK